MLNPVIIFGAKAFGSLALDIFKSHGILVYGFLDDDKTLHNTEIGDVLVLGSTDDEQYLKLIGKKCDAFIASDENKLKRYLTAFLIEKRQVMPINAIHSKAIVSSMAILKNGSLIGPNAIVQPRVEIGNHCIVNCQAVIEAGAKLGDFVQIGTGAIIGPEVVVEEGAFIGTGAIVVGGITIGKNASIGAGSLVIEPVKGGTTVFGSPAKKI
jgi:sugar O-acyltransferase (sialic acid O-acetyltransferase NeuD family)